MEPMFDERLVKAVTGAVGHASSADEAVANIAEALPPAFDASRIGLRWYDAAADYALVVAVWSRRPTNLSAGMGHVGRLAVFDSFTAVLETKTSDFRVVGDRVGLPTVVEELLIAEGNASGVQVPLMEGDEVHAVLSILSGNRDTFADADPAYFDTIGQANSAVLIPLARTAASTFDVRHGI